MTMLAFALAFAGFAALCLSMERHHGEVFGTRRVPPRRRLLLQIAGWVLLALSFPATIAGWGWSFGPAAWCGLLTLAAAPIVLLLPWRPRLVLWLAPVLAACGLLAAWI